MGVTHLSSSTKRQGRFEVLIAGGGVAALEAALALRNLAGERARLTLLAPDQEFVYRPLTVREPFGYAVAERHPLARIASAVDMRLIKGSFAWLDRTAQIVHTESGRQLRYDALMLCLGAGARACYQHAITIDDRHLDEQLHGLIQDIEGGYVGRLAFLAPARMAWPLPLYELALMSAEQAAGMCIELAITVLTPEPAPLHIFGDSASRGVSALLAERGIEVICSAHCEVPQAGRIVIRPGRRALSVDRIVSLPELYGPHARGLPCARDGFIPVDHHCQVRGVPRVYAAGDATDCAIKHGGIAAQQADTAAQAIAALAGAPVQPSPFDPVIHGMLLTGAAPRYLSARITGGHGYSSQFTDQPTWSPPAKIAAKYLAPYLEQIGS
jgi:sulfide:quinone oxidoreductase